MCQSVSYSKWDLDLLKALVTNYLTLGTQQKRFIANNYNINYTTGQSFEIINNICGLDSSYKVRILIKQQHISNSAF